MSFNADFWRFPLRISTLPSGVLHRVVVCHSTQSSISVRKTNVDVVFILPLISPAAERLPVVFIFLFSLLYIIQYCSEKLLLLQKKMSAWKLEWIVPSFTDFHSITNSSGVKLEPSVGGGWCDNIYTVFDDVYDSGVTLRSLVGVTVAALQVNEQNWPCEAAEFNESHKNQLVHQVKAELLHGYIGFCSKIK